MKSGQKTSLTLRWLRSMLFLALVCFSQVYLCYHLHHFHDNDLSEFEISSHPIDNNVSDHHHHGDRPHTLGKHVDWHFTRPQAPRAFTIDSRYLVSSVRTIVTNDDRPSYVNYERPLFIDEAYVSCPVIRGPPFA